MQEKFSRKPGESETEYLWHVSLNGGDRVLLSKEEARGYWGPGVFLDVLGSAGIELIFTGTWEVGGIAGAADLN